MRTGRIGAVVFDFGGVLTGPVGDSIAAWQHADGIVPDSFSRVLRAWLSRSVPQGTPIHLLETGAITVGEFEVLLAAELATVDGSAVVAEGLLSRLFAGLRVDPMMVELVREVGSSGLRTGLLSNSWGDMYPRALLDEIFHSVVISGEVGLRKPDHRIYAMMLERIGIPPEEAVFIDDAEPNTDAAAAFGMHAILHTDPGETRARLAELVPQLMPPAVDPHRREGTT